jgi:hypothetical protein
VWQQRGSDFVLVAIPLKEFPPRPHLADVVRATFTSAYKLTTTSDGQTKVEFVALPDFGGNIPQFIINSSMRRFLSTVSDLRTYFEVIKTMEMERERTAGVGLLPQTSAVDDEGGMRHGSTGKLQVRQRERASERASEGASKRGEPASEGVSQ